MKAQEYVVPDAITWYNNSIRIVFEWEPENKIVHGVCQAGLNALVVFKIANTKEPILVVGASFACRIGNIRRMGRENIYWKFSIAQYATS